MTKSHNRSSLWSVWCLVMVLLLVNRPDGCDGWGKTMAEEGGGNDNDATTAESTTTTTATAPHPHHNTPEEQASMLNQVDIAAQLKDQSLNAISSEDALAIAGLLDALMSDTETQSMVRNLKATTDGGDATNDQDNPQLQAFVQDATPSEIAMGMVQLLEELRGLNYLYSKLDPARAVEEMYHDGMVDESNVDYFRSHPEQLPLQIESGLYFSFVTLAVAGGYL